MGKKTLGLDLGIASIGWCLFQDDDEGNPEKIIDLGSYVFDQIEDNKGETENIVRRQKRLMRRQRRRTSNRLEDGRKLFAKYFHLDFFEDVVEKLPISFNEDGSPANPFQLKAKGLENPLSKEELCIVLYHYLKFRGFKSNRKKVKPKDDEDKKLLEKMKDFEKRHFEEGRPFYPTLCLLKDFEERSETDTGARIHNDRNNYYLTVRREWYDTEIVALLNKQKEHGVIANEFVDDYLNLWRRQRDYSDGPSEESPYHVVPAERIGKCAFDGKPRAFKDTITAKRFVLLSALNNFSYKIDPEQTEYSRLTPEQIRTAENECIFAEKITYKQLLKKVAIDPDSVADIKGLRIGKKDYRDFVASFCKEHDIEGTTIPYEKSDEFNIFLKQKTLEKRTFYKGSAALKAIQKIKKVKDAGDDCIDAFIIAFGFYKTDEKLRNCFIFENAEKDKDDSPLETEIKRRLRGLNLNEAEIDEILSFDEKVSGTIDLSLELCKKINPEMRNGLTYDKAMAKAGFNHSGLRQSNEQTRMPELDVCLAETKQTLTNPVVRNTLVRMRRVINAIIDRYGFFDDCAIELGREIKKDFEERSQIQRQQLDNLSDNDRYRNEMIEKFPQYFKSYGNISRKKDSLLKYRLYREQRGVSPYTNEPINEARLFDDGWYEIDHILPFSRSFDDSISNKVLVEKRCNQEKRNRTPLEWLETDAERAPLHTYINSHAIDPNKKRKLLATEISKDFLNKDGTDNAYIARLARKLITYYVLPAGAQCRSVSGGITARLRDMWGLSGHTHSYLAPDNYKAKPMSKYIFQGMEKVEGENKKLIFKYKYDEKDLRIEVIPDSQKKKQTDIKNTSKHDQMLERFLNEDFYNYFSQKFLNLKSMATGVEKLQEAISAPSNNEKDSERRECGLYILSYVRNKLQEDSNEKDRSNHLHHALDAAVIACSSPRLIQRITKEYQRHEDSLPEYDENGELVFPYPGFREEVLTRVYERDQEILLAKLNSLPNYKVKHADKKTVHVLIPARSPKTNVSGPLSKETVLGVNDAGETIRKVSLAKFAKAKKGDKQFLEMLAKMENKDSGNKATYEACKSWIETDQDSRGAYPIIKKKGTPVKAIKIIDGKAKEKVDLSNGRFADNEDVVRIDVYKKRNGGDEYYFVPIFYWQIEKERHAKQKGLKLQTFYTLMWARGNQKCQIDSESLKNNYKLIYKIPRYSLLEIDYSMRGKSLANFKCYSGGASSGLFEVYSPLGDGWDMVLDSDRFLLTVSCIKKIKVKSISVLGHIS